MSIAPGYASGTVLGSADIVEQARALRDDVDLIYEFVHNNIEFLPTYGSQKGAWGTIVDGMGNSFDQSELMIELLREAGYTASYQLGELELTQQEASDWLGSDPNNIWAARNLLNEGFIPNEVIWTGTEYKLRMTHCFVKVDISGTDYVFDPAKKAYTTVVGIDLKTAMGYSQSTFMTNAKSGSTQTVDYIKDVNRTNVHNDLKSFTSNLVSWIKNNDHDASFDEIVGGKTIDEVIGQLRQTVLPYLRSGTTPTVWTGDIPDTYKATLRVLYDSPNIDITYFSKDIHGKRLTLTFNGSNEAELRLDGVLQATSSAQGVGTWNSVLLEPKHPYATTWADQSFWQRIWAGHPYLIAQAWGNAGRGMMNLHKKKWHAGVASGLAIDSEGVFGEALATTWHTWIYENNRSTDIINKFTECRTMYHHQVGVFGHFNTVLGDLPGIMWKSAALDNDWNNVNTNDTALAMHGISFEAAVLEHSFDLGGVSSAPLMDIANSNSDKIFIADSSNWLTNVKPNLLNYSSQTLTDIENWWINAGWKVAVPENGNQTAGSWQGHGYYAISPWQGAVGIIGGGLKGVDGKEPKVVNLLKLKKQIPKLDKRKPIILKGRIQKGTGKGGTTDSGPVVDVGTPDGSPTVGPPPPQPPIGEPANSFTGHFFHSEEDLTVGAAEQPYSLSFVRNYDTASKLTKDSLGYGWSHNHQVSLSIDSDAEASFGAERVTASAAAIVELFITVDLYKDLTKPIDKWVVVALSNNWLNEQTWKSAVVLSGLSIDGAFVKMPSGTYENPLDLQGELVKNIDDTYTFTNNEGTKYNFDTDGKLTSEVHPYGVTVTYTYTSGKLTSISNGLGRTLTLSYTGDNLTQVSDGTGRSVSYSVDAQGKLTSVTNVESNSISYEYDTEKRLKKIFYPENPSTAFLDNTFDSLDRLKEQRDADNLLTSFYFAGNRTELVDPGGSSLSFYWNRFGKAKTYIDELGNSALNEFDGLGRRVKFTYPEGNAIEYEYDLNDNVVTTRLKAKPASGLADVVSSRTYDTTWKYKGKTFTDGRGNTWTNNYDATSGKVLSTQAPQVGGSVPTISYTYNSRGQLLTRTDETGIVTKYVYDATTEKLTSVVHDDGVGKLNLTSFYAYNSRGDIISVTDMRGKVTTQEYNNSRNITKITDPAPLSYKTEVSYNKDGRVSSVKRETGDLMNPWQIVNYAYTVSGNLQSVINPSGDAIDFTYDSAGRLWKKTFPVSATEDRVWEFAYDDVNRVETIKDPSGTISETRTYTDNNLLASVKDAENNVTQFSYDGFDRPDKTTYPDSSYEQAQSYDDNGNLTGLRTRSGSTINYTFDVLNREVTRSPQGQGAVTNTYDLAGRLVKFGKPAVANDPSTGDFEYFYDSAGRFWKEKYPDGKTVVHELDDNGNLEKTTWPDGYYVERVFDELNRLTDIKLNGAASAAVHMNWDALSRRTSTTYENGAVTSYTHQIDDDLATLLHTFVGSSVTFTFGRNKAHQIVSKQVSDDQYMWHPASAGTTTYGVANNLNQYPTVGGQTYSYNQNGCITGDGTWTYSYDTENHLVSATKVGTTASFVYDPKHRQAQKQVGATKTRFIYSDWQRIADYDGSTGNLLDRYVYGLDLDELLIKIDSSGSKTYFHADNQGSIIARSNTTGNVTNKYKYGPFGETNSLAGTTHGYTGQRFDAETGLYYYKLRYYSPEIGRFLQPDPIGFGDGLNLYSYVHNDAVTHFDPMGLKTAPPPSARVPISSGCNVITCRIEKEEEEETDFTISGPFGIFGPGIKRNIVDNPGGFAFNFIPIPGAAGLAGKVTPQLRGKLFEKFVLNLTGLSKNSEKFAPKGKVKSIVDSILNKPNTFVEIKDVINISDTAQLRSIAATAKSRGARFDLIVSERNTNITQTVIDAVKGTKGNIIQVNSVSGVSKILH